MAEIHLAAIRLSAALEVIRRAGNHTPVEMTALLADAITDEIERAHPDSVVNQLAMLATVLGAIRDAVVIGTKPDA